MCPFSNQNSVKFRLSQSVDRNVEMVSLYLHCYFEVLSNSYSIHRGYSNFLLNMAFISLSEVENIYIS